MTTLVASARPDLHHGALDPRSSRKRWPRFLEPDPLQQGIYRRLGHLLAADCADGGDAVR